MNSSQVVGKEQCPKCASLGKDTSKDNLIIYSDGHKHCYSCSYHIDISGVERFKQKEMKECKIKKENPIFLPYDCDINFPQRTLDWIKKYDLTKIDLYNHNVMWSDSIQRLIFPVYSGGILVAWQGRSFNTQDMGIAKIPKWYGKGDLKNTFNILGNNLGRGDKLVLTEDIVSAIKVSKCSVMAMPLYGCVVGQERFKRLYNLFKNEIEVVVWLDDDKRKEGAIEAKLGRLLGLNVTTISTELDPKEIPYNKIKEIIGVNNGM